MAINQITTMPEIPTLGDPSFSPKMFALATAIKAMVPEINSSNAQVDALRLAVQADAQEVERDKNDAANARTQAQQYSQTASNASIAAQTALTACLDAKQATLDAASEVGALDLTKARKAVKRQNAQFFKLNLL